MPQSHGLHVVRLDDDTINYVVFLQYADEIGKIGSRPWNNTSHRFTEWDDAVTYANSRAHDIGDGGAGLILLDVWIESVIGPHLPYARDPSWAVKTDGDVWPLAERYDRPPKAREHRRFCLVEREGRGRPQPLATRLTYPEAVDLLTDTLDRRTARTALWINEGAAFRPRRTFPVTLPARGRREASPAPR